MSAVAVSAVVFGNVAAPARPFITLWFLLVCPGMAFVRSLRIHDRIAQWTLAVALSLALDTIVAGVFLYSGRWSPANTLIVLICISFLGVLLQVGLAYARLLRVTRQRTPEYQRSWGPAIAFTATLVVAALVGVIIERIIPITSLAMPNHTGGQTSSSNIADNPAQTEVAEVTPLAGVSPMADPLIPQAVPSVSTTANASDVAQPSITAPELNTRIFVEESFDTPSDEWPSRATATSEIDYFDGRYQMTLRGQSGIAVIRDIPFENYRLSVDVAVQQGGAGLLFLSSGPNLFYRFVITPDGAFAIQLEDRANQTVTNLVDWTESQALQRTPEQTNRLRLERMGATTRFFADDQLLTDFTIPEGAVATRYGLTVTSRSGEGQATFDNLFGEQLTE